MTAGWHGAPSLPIAVLLAVGPAIAVAQFRTMAPAVTLVFALTVLAHWRTHHALPWPRPGLALALAAGLLGWCLVSALWSIEAARAVQTTLSLAALVVLGAMAARAVAADGLAPRLVGPALAGGLALGFALMAFDHATPNLFRRAVRGMPEWSPFIGFGLKPAASLFALLLPLMLAAALPWAVRLAVVAAGASVVLWLPGESAKLALLAGLAVAGAAMLAPRLAARGAAAALALLIVAAPLAFGAIMARAPDLGGLPRTAAHRVLIWDFALDRIAERPLLGWGMESSRAIPGGDAQFGATTLARFGLNAPDAREWFAAPAAKRLPLHTHNAALQIWLELGAIGALLAAALAAAVVLRATLPAALGAAASGAVTGMLSFGVWQPWWIASLLLALVVASALRTAPAGSRSPPPYR